LNLHRMQFQLLLQRQDSVGTTITKPTGAYYIPLDIPNYPKTDARGYPVPPLIAKYDPKGKLKSISSQERYWADSANSIVVQPEYNLKGELVSTNAAKNEGGGGGFGDFLRTALEDFGPMIALGVGANYLAPLLSGAGAAAAPAAAAGSLSPYAAQAAGAYGGSAAAAGAAAAGNLAGIQAASAAQNALTQQGITGLTWRRSAYSNVAGNVCKSNFTIDARSRNRNNCFC
jgi:hypothetical protein